MQRVILALLAATLVACSSQGSLPTDAVSGLPILDQLPAFPGSAGAVAWRETTEPAEGLGAGDTAHSTIGELVAALRELAAQEGVELTVGFLGPPAAEEATLVVHVAGSGDETVAGDELVAELRRNQRGWYVERIRFRSHCRRAVDPETGACA